MSVYEEVNGLKFREIADGEQQEQRERYSGKMLGMGKPTCSKWVTSGRWGQDCGKAATHVLVEGIAPNEVEVFVCKGHLAGAKRRAANRVKEREAYAEQKSTEAVLIERLSRLPIRASRYYPQTGGRFVPSETHCVVSIDDLERLQGDTNFVPDESDIAAMNDRDFR